MPIGLTLKNCLRTYTVEYTEIRLDIVHCSMSVESLPRQPHNIFSSITCQFFFNLSY